MDDERWFGLEGGYKVPYDPREALRRLANGDTVSAWNELWDELHHQGDIGLASFAAVPALVRIHEARSVADWNTYALAATIEEARDKSQNPRLPEWLRDDYERAWRDLERLALAEFSGAADDNLIHSLVAVLALSKGLRTLGRMAMLTEDERQEMLGEAGWG